MNNIANNNFGSLEGRTFIIGREGHIYVEDPAASKEHAAIKIVDGKIHIRDLNSTNGLYVLKGNTPIRFKEGFVEPHETIAIGQETHTIQNLLKIVGAFAV